MLGQNLVNFDTKGASSVTAAQDGLKAGIDASKEMAKTDWTKLSPYLERFKSIGTKHQINPSILLAISSREARGGSALINGWGDNYNAFGCMQIDKRYHTIRGLTAITNGSPDPFSENHIDQATEILLDYYHQVKDKLGWDEDWSLKGAIVAYNSGVKNVQTKEGLNKGTTGNDYGDDVIARAQYYEQKIGKNVIVISPSVEKKFHRNDNRKAIICLKTTWLKKKPTQAIYLSHNQKKIAYEGVGYYALMIDESEQGHLRVKLDYGSGTWYIFAEHWEIKPARNLGVSAPNSKLKLFGSVGLSSLNNSTDVVALKNRLGSLGYGEFIDYTSVVDHALISSIKLFQSIIRSSTSLIGDGRVDPDGITNRWLNASNAPRWGVLTKEGEGFISIEAIETWDFHDFGCSWLDETIIEIGKEYEKTYRKKNKSISLILVNDVSLKHGGDTPDHAGHETGNAVDLRLPVKGGSIQTVVNHWNDSRYDRDAAIALLKIINKHYLFKRAFFNDPQAINAGLCSRANGHDNHIHFEIKAPQLKN